MKFRTVLLFGAPGAGKGTQGKVLAAIPNFYHFSSGDMFRRLSGDTELGALFLQYSSKGQLVPDEPTIRLWRHHMETVEKEGRFNPRLDTLLLDGLPRNRRQAELMQPHIDVKCVIHLGCADPTKLVARLQRRALLENRLDDSNVDVIRRRLETYDQETRPILDFYSPDLVRTIDATQTPMNVARSVLDVLGQVLPN